MNRAQQAAGQQTVLPCPDPPRHPTVRVVIPCSKSKLFTSAPATRRELDERRGDAERRLIASTVAARDLYTGRAYRRAVAAVDRASLTRADMPIALHIASAGYGLIDTTHPVVPYEATMGRNRAEWIDRGKRLGMPGRALELVESCALTIFALPQPYLHAIGLDHFEPHRGQALVISTSSRFPSARMRAIRVGRALARALGTTEREVWAVVLERLLEYLSRGGLEAAATLPGDPLNWPSP